MKWMESFLADGAVSGKIICPNEKCRAKLGNFDWAGVMCSCREWVIPVSDFRSPRPKLFNSLIRGFASRDRKLMRLLRVNHLNLFCTVLIEKNATVSIEQYMWVEWWERTRKSEFEIYFRTVFTLISQYPYPTPSSSLLPR
jgi:hypothetical protein